MVVLQTIAWTGMAVTRTPQVGMEEAVRTTFDGKHPCRLCTAIAGAEKQTHKEKSPLQPSKASKLEMVQSLTVALSAPRSIDFSFNIQDLRVTARADAPRTPPPRLG
jgi:hypothetical protein